MNNFEERYQFIKTTQRISITLNLKKHTNDTRRIWRSLKDNDFDFLGVVREWSAGFRDGNHYVMLHHFVKEKPIKELVGEWEVLSWCEMLNRGVGIGLLLTELEEMGFNCFLPVQAYTDAYIHDQTFIDWDWHLESPKHKLQVWCLGEEVSVLVELFIDMPLPPYGLGEALDWPKLDTVTEYIQDPLFDFEELVDIEQPTSSNSGEVMEIQEQVDPDLLEQTRAAIAKIFTEMDRVVLALSGGKDSQSCLLLSLEYLLNNPDCGTEFAIISSDTGVENPLIVDHVHKLKEKVESLGLNIPFYIVQPELENGYLVCVLGRSYSPPSSLFKYCVSRLKIDPSTKELEQMIHPDLKTCLILGSRSAESTTRARSVSKHFGEDFYGTHRVAHLRTAAPIREWTASDVVTYLVRNPAPWEGYGNYELINLYGSAGGFGECPVGAAIASENDAVKSCSGPGSRFGCWSCTVINSDESLRNLTYEYPELEPYYEFRNILKHTQQIRYGGMTGYQRISKGFGSGLGDLTIDIRTLLLLHMKRLGIPISEDEVYTIYRFVCEREAKEGIPVTRRFRESLFAFLEVHPGVVGAMYNPIWDPYGCGVDRFTQADVDAIQRVLDRQAEQSKKTGLEVDSIGT